MAVRRRSRPQKPADSPEETPMLPSKKRPTLSKISKRLSLPTPRPKAKTGRAKRKSAPIDHGQDDDYESGDELSPSRRSSRASRTRAHYADYFVEDEDFDADYSASPTQGGGRRSSEDEERDSEDRTIKRRGRPKGSTTGSPKKEVSRKPTGSRTSGRATKHASFRSYFEDDDLAFINRKTFGRVSDNKTDRSLKNECIVKLTPLHKIPRYRKYLSKTIWKRLAERAERKRKGRKRKQHKKAPDEAYHAPKNVHTENDSPSRKSARATEVTYVTYLSDYEEESDFSDDYVLPKKKANPSPSGKKYGGDHSLRKKKRVRYGEDLWTDDPATNATARRARANRVKKRSEPMESQNDNVNGLAVDSVAETEETPTNGKESSHSTDQSEGGSTGSVSDRGEDDVQEKPTRKNPRISASFDSGAEDGRRPMKKRRSARKGLHNITT